MEKCPECGYENPEGALLCENCGALLFIRPGPQGQTARIEEDTVPEEVSGNNVRRGTSTFETGMKLVLHYKENETDAHQVVLVDDEITLGRVDEHTSFLPDVNLSRMAAWERGVSRLHAAIRRTGSKLFLIDLASTNGTFLNGTRIPAREPQLMRDGDQVRLGLFEMTISFTQDDA